MKSRVRRHKNRGEVEQYVKLSKRYGENFGFPRYRAEDGYIGFFTEEAKYSEFNRRYKRTVFRDNKKPFRSARKAMLYYVRRELLRRS